MFNSPRAQQRYSTTGAANNNVANPLTASVNDVNGVQASVYDGLDPWSSVGTPEIGPVSVFGGNGGTGGVGGLGGGLGSVIGDATIPPIYTKSFALVDTSNSSGSGSGFGSGETSVNALSRVLGTSRVGAAVVDRIVNLVSTRPRVSKVEFFVALALVALAQQGKDISIEQVASLASHNTLPEPSLDLESLQTSAVSGSGAAPPYRFRRDSGKTGNNMYAAEDPWSGSASVSAPVPRYPTGGGVGGNIVGSITNGVNVSSGMAGGTGLSREWWKKQEKVGVSVQGMQGFILNRYTVYEISSDRGAPVARRYSEFVFLWDCLVRRYPFRIIPQLPPKRIGPDDHFIEMRRRGLARFLNFIVNHPVIKEDGLLAAFLSEPSLEEWRKHAAISLEEESTNRRVDRVEEMSIPSDLEDKLLIVRRKIGQLIEQWQKICILTERLVKRREAAAVRDPHALFKRSFMSAHLFTSPVIRSSSSSATSSSNVFASPLSSSTASLTSSTVFPAIPSPSMSTSIFGTFGSTPLFGSNRPDGSADGGFYTSYFVDGGNGIGNGNAEQADLSRLNITLNALNEINAECWRGDAEGCELCDGVRSGVEHVSAHVQRRSDEMEERTRNMSLATLEAVKSQRDLYIAVRDLFIRHDRLSGDQVERLKKRIDANQMKLEGVRSTRKEGWEIESEKITALIERDQAGIVASLSRRVFIRFCMWHELRVVMHNRENTLLTQAVRDLVREEVAYAETAVMQWTTLSEALENMPFE